MSDDMILQTVGHGAAPQVVVSYGRAVMSAARLRTVLVSAGLGAETVLVVPSLTEAGEPVVYLNALTDPAAESLAHILRGGTGPPGRATLPYPGDGDGRPRTP